MALSFSRLSRFENCPASFEYLYINKSVQDPGNEKSQYGNRVHESLELYGRALAERDSSQAEAIEALDDEAKQWFPLVRKIVAQPGHKHFEQQVSVTRDKQPTGWFDKDVWLRSIIDVLIVDGSTAHCIDWKTGKKKEDPTQMQLFAAMIFAHFPEVDTVKTSLVWLAANDITPATFQRRYVHSLWGALEPRFVRVQDAADLGVFPTKPSGLCPWCPAKDICPDARKRK